MHPSVLIHSITIQLTYIMCKLLLLNIWGIVNEIRFRSRLRKNKCSWFFVPRSWFFFVCETTRLLQITFFLGTLIWVLKTIIKSNINMTIFSMILKHRAVENQCCFRYLYKILWITRWSIKTADLGTIYKRHEQGEYITCLHWYV